MPDKLCYICNTFKDVDLFKVKDGYKINNCNDCLKKRSNKNNKKMKKRIQDVSGDCWWVEQYCYASIFYHENKKRR